MSKGDREFARTEAKYCKDVEGRGTRGGRCMMKDRRYGETVVNNTKNLIGQMISMKDVVVYRISVCIKVGRVRGTPPTRTEGTQQRDENKIGAREETREKR